MKNAVENAGHVVVFGFLCAVIYQLLNKPADLHHWKLWIVHNSHLDSLHVQFPRDCRGRGGGGVTRIKGSGRATDGKSLMWRLMLRLTQPQNVHGEWERLMTTARKPAPGTRRRPGCAVWAVNADLVTRAGLQPRVPLILPAVWFLRRCGDAVPASSPRRALNFTGQWAETESLKVPKRRTSFPEHDHHAQQLPGA